MPRKCLTSEDLVAPLIEDMKSRDWVARHEFYKKCLGWPRTFAFAVHRFVSPDFLLDGTLSGRKPEPGEVIALPDKSRTKRQGTLDPVVVKRRRAC